MGMLAIYFAGAIRGGRDDAEIYTRLIDFLGRFGTVLTCHVGDAALLAEERGMSEGEIFARDMAWLRAADLVVAEVTTPSLGVGFEVAMAQALAKPICCLYQPREGRRLSAMIAGNPSLAVHPYGEVQEAEAVLAEFVATVVRGRGGEITDEITRSALRFC